MDPSKSTKLAHIHYAINALAEAASWLVEGNPEKGADDMLTRAAMHLEAARKAS